MERFAQGAFHVAYKQRMIWTRCAASGGARRRTTKESRSGCVVRLEGWDCGYLTDLRPQLIAAEPANVSSLKSAIASTCEKIGQRNERITRPHDGVSIPGRSVLTVFGSNATPARVRKAGRSDDCGKVRSSGGNYGSQNIIGEL